MLHAVFGTDRKAARVAAHKAAGAGAIVITDAHAFTDFEMVLQRGGMFAPKKGQAVILDGVLARPEMRERLLASLTALAEAADTYVILEEKPDAEAKKAIEKHAGKATVFDLPKKPEDKTIFALANALERRDKKALWLGLMREYGKGAAPEAVHGLLFWGAKQMLLKARDEGSVALARALVARLAALPHEARRAGGDLGYALEAFALSGM